MRYRRDTQYNSAEGATIHLPLPMGDSPVRGNVCETDKGVWVSGGKGVGIADGEGAVSALPQSLRDCSLKEGAIIKPS